MRRLLLFFFGTLLPFSVFAQDVIHKNDSTTLEARVQEIGEAEIKYKKFSNPDGPTYTVKKSEVSYIVYQNGDKEVYTVPKPIVAPVAFDTLAYIEKMLGVTLKEVTTPDTGVLIVDVVKTGRVKAPGLEPPKGQIIQYIGTSDKKSDLKATGRKIVTREDAMRAIVYYKSHGAEKVYLYTRFSQYVNHVYTANITDLVFEQEKIVEKAKADSVAQKAKLPSPFKHGHWLINVGSSFRNNYSTIELTQWMYVLNGIPATYDDGMTDGPEAYYFGSISYNFPLNKKKARPVCVGVGFTMNYWRDINGFWSIQGRVVSYASTSPVNYMRLRPLKLGLAIPFQFPITDYSAFTFTPTLLYAKVHGRSTGSTDPDLRYYGGASTGFGISADAGLNIFVGKKKMISFSGVIGLRILETELYSIPENGTEYTQVTFADGRPVHVELDGLYILIGTSVRFAKKQ
jgi:hypothetical protein